jgi:hypothetical protein
MGNLIFRYWWYACRLINAKRHIRLLHVIWCLGITAQSGIQPFAHRHVCAAIDFCSRPHVLAFLPTIPPIHFLLPPYQSVAADSEVILRFQANFAIPISCRRAGTDRHYFYYLSIQFTSVFLHYWLLLVLSSSHRDNLRLDVRATFLFWRDNVL